MPDSQSNPSQTIHKQCCIVGGGPAGMMLGFLLARAGVDVVVLEKHADFLRDFRGDTIHPSTLELLHELGVLEDFLRRPHQKSRQLHAYVGDESVIVADFSHLPTQCKYVAFMPQWDFLDFISTQARAYPTFQLIMNSEVTDLLWDGGRVVGVRAGTREGMLEVRADLVVGADGRSSTVRQSASLPVRNLGAPMDVLWLRLPRDAGDPEEPIGRFDQGRILIMLNRGDYWQIGFVIVKSGYDQVRQRGLPAFRTELAAVCSFAADRVESITSWDQVRLLTVRVDRLTRWSRSGLLCIGDSAHAMSPVGGVGINLAIQDAVAAANILAVPLREGTVSRSDLERVQHRRDLPTRITQQLQVLIQNRVIGHVLNNRNRIEMPWPLRLVRRCPVLRRIPARLIGMGFRPEHIHSPDVAATS